MGMMIVKTYDPIVFLGYGGFNSNEVNLMPTCKHYIFVLWGHNFDEQMATIFVTELRRAGWLVKVVGLTPGTLSGVHGLALLPDLTLGQALPLASRAVCIIIPTTSLDFDYLHTDPRLHNFIQQATVHGAQFVIGPLPNNLTERLTGSLTLIPSPKLITYAVEDNERTLVKELIILLNKK